MKSGSSQDTEIVESVSKKCMSRTTPGTQAPTQEMKMISTEQNSRQLDLHVSVHMYVAHWLYMRDSLRVASMAGSELGSTAKEEPFRRDEETCLVKQACNFAKTFNNL